jgi:Zn-dependent M28 family amino/carboxypeptidase
MRRRRLLLILAIPAVLLTIGAAAVPPMVTMPGESYRGTLPPADAALRAMADALRAPVVELATHIGERNAPRRARELAAAAEYLAARFKDAGHSVQSQTFQVDKVECRNLEVEIKGRTRQTEIVVVAAHYDSAVGTPAADDNASGVSALLWLARQFGQRRGERTLRLVAVTNEEPPYFQTANMGSAVYARRCRQRRENVTAMLSLEMLGCYSDDSGSQKYPFPFSLLYPSTGNFIAFIGNTASADLVRQVTGAFRRAEKFPSEGAALPASLPGVGFSDQWSFWQEGYPGLMVTDTAMFRYPHYHEASDTPDKIDFERMARVVRGLERVIAELIAAPAAD